MSQDPTIDTTATLTFTGSVQALGQILARIQEAAPQKNKTRTKLRLTSISPGPSSAAADVAAPSLSSAAETGTASPAATPTDATTEGLDYAQVSEATLRLVAEKGKPAAVALLESFGVSNARALGEGRWAAYLGAVTAALED